MLLFIIPLIWFIFLTGFKHGEDDVRQLSCHSHNRLLRFHSFFVTDIRTAKSSVPVNAYPCSLHNLRTEFFVSTECLFTVDNLVPATVACGDKPEIGCKLSLITEAVEVAYFCQESHCHADANTGNGGQQFVVMPITFAAAEFPYLSCCQQQVLTDAFHLCYQQIKRGACTGE